MCVPDRLSRGPERKGWDGKADYVLQREIYWNGLQDLVWVASNNGLHTGGTENHPVPAQPTRLGPQQLHLEDPGEPLTSVHMESLVDIRFLGAGFTGTCEPPNVTLKQNETKQKSNVLGLGRWLTIRNVSCINVRIWIQISRKV